MDKLIKFGSDTKHRKDWFTGISFSHPAKMMLPLQLWIIDNFTKEGETILDLMAGSGTILVACSMGRHVITCELEDKFVQMQKDNWQKIQQRGCQMGYSMGTATILQGDARSLEGLLVDKCVFSPPYAENTHHSDNPLDLNLECAKGRKGRVGGTAGNSEGQIGQLPYGEIDKIITSPPYANQNPSLLKSGIISNMPEKLKGAERRELVKSNGYSESSDNLGNLPYGDISAIITSPPYEGSLSESKNTTSNLKREERLQTAGHNPKEFMGGIGRNASLEDGMRYSHSLDNIGNLKSDSYLSAMLLVYQNCYSILKDGGLLILVTKNFIRNKKQVRLDLDTIKLCEQAGFTFQDRWYRELQSQSFWRTIYYQKFPEVEPIKFEDILVFNK